MLRNKFEIAEYLLSCGANINCHIDDTYYTALVICICIYNRNPCRGSSHSDSAKLEDVERGIVNCEDGIKFLIEYGASVNMDSDYDCIRSLSNDTKIFVKRIEQYISFLNIVKEGNLEKIRQYLADGISVNFRYYNSRTALMIACKNGNYEVALTLISAGADINAREYKKTTKIGEILGTYGKSVLNYAAEGGNTKIMELLLARGAK